MDIFRTSFDIFWTSCRHSHFLGYPTICPLQELIPSHFEFDFESILSRLLVATQIDSRSTRKTHEGETHPKKTPTRIKAQFAQIIVEELVQIILLFDLKRIRKQPERLLFGWMVVWVACLPFKNSSKSTPWGDRGRCWFRAPKGGSFDVFAFCPFSVHVWCCDCMPFVLNAFSIYWTTLCTKNSET